MPHHKREPDEEEILRVEVVERALENEEVEQVARTSAQVLMAQRRKQGLNEGRQEGRIEGREEGRTALLLAQLEFKFGMLSLEAKEKISNYSQTRSMLSGCVSSTPKPGMSWG